jgi:long-chain acyl-CoA synthetase
VPLHSIDTAGSSVYILNNSRASFLVTVSYARWNSLAEFGEDLPHLQQVVLTNESDSGTSLGHIPYCGLEEWLASGRDIKELPGPPSSEDLAAIVYTSGTTGRPKGVMLTHTNIVSNTLQTIGRIGVTEQDEFLSFLPLSHTFERTVTYYSALACGACLSICRGMAQLADDLV